MRITGGHEYPYYAPHYCAKCKLEEDECECEEFELETDRYFDECKADDERNYPND